MRKRKLYFRIGSKFGLIRYALRVIKYNIGKVQIVYNITKMIFWWNNPTDALHVYNHTGAIIVVVVCVSPST